MTKQVFGKVIAFTIVICFSISCFLPIIDGIVLSQLKYTTDESCFLMRQCGRDDDTVFRPRPEGPTSKVPLSQTTLPQQELVLNRGYFYGYCAYGGPGAGWVTFDDPGYLMLISGPIPDLFTGADIDCEGNCYGCAVSGGLYLIDLDNGWMTYIGPTIVGVNGMTYDTTTGTWYVTSSNSLYIMDVTTGATTLVGSHGITNTMIAIACNLDGDMYGYDVLFTGHSHLYSIDKSTGAATTVGDMGYGMVYAQDCAFDRNNDILYVAAYFNDGSPSALMICDVATGACTPVGIFQGGAEIDGLVIPYSCYQFDHDITIKSIVQPSSENARVISPVVRVQNVGLNTETDVPVQHLIGKELISGTLEDFEVTNGSYSHAPKVPQPDAWQWGIPTSGPGAAYSGSNVWATNLAGVYPPSMWCYLVTPPFVVPSNMMFNFWHWYYFESNYDGGNVKISDDGGATWTLITPVGGYPGSMPFNPFMTGQAAYNGQSGGWVQAVFDLSDFEGETVQIMFETASDSSVQYTGWYLDDVGFTSTSWVNEYNQTMIIPTIAPDEVVNLEFPTWTPTDLGSVELVNINYNAEATAMLADDENVNNDYKAKPFTLHYGYFDDVAVTDIVSPVSGLAQTQTPEVTVENQGQNAENVSVQLTIGKANYNTLFEEDFAGGVPPAGWGTNYPSNWFSSSTNYAGGTAPEAVFSWTPSSVGEHLLYTSAINTTGYSALLLRFKEYVNDYNSDYTLKVVTSTDGGTTWTDAYERGGGPYGPATTEVALTTGNGVGSANLQIAWDMSGDSFNINYWYIDDVWMGIINVVEEYNETLSDVPILPGETLEVVLPDWTPADIPFATTIDYLINAQVSMNISDEDPMDNEIGRLITLSYEHDVGVIVITEPSGPSREMLIWDNYADDGTGTGLSSQLDEVYPFNSQCADDFQFDSTMDVTIVHWWGAFWNGATYPNPTEFNIIFYIDNGDMPSGAGMEDPTPTALACYNFPEVTGVLYGTDKYEYEAQLDPPFEAYAGVKYWIAIQAVCVFSNDGQWGWSTNGANPDQLSIPVQGFPLLGTPYWTPTEYGDHAFQLWGQEHGWQPYWPPGTYQVAGIMQNLGGVYPEINIPVNTQVKNDTGVIVYDETVNVPGPLAPGETAQVNFPDITIEWAPDAEGNYLLTMKTMLPGDDHPNNDKKTLTFKIGDHGMPPPPTTAILNGTMGNNGWYISCVTITLTASGEKWPQGVNHTYYKIDDGEWIEYNESFTVCDDGPHTVYFYSEYNDGSIEEVRSVDFKIDKTAPIIISYNATAQNPLMTEWLLQVTAIDPTSGIVFVEFFADDGLIGNVTHSPYIFSVEGKIHTTQCVVYDAAGNSQMSDIVTACEFSNKEQYFNFLWSFQGKQKNLL